VDVVNNRSLIVNITPGAEVLDLTVTGRLPNGRKAVWHIRVVTHTGEILTSQNSANSDQQTDRENVQRPLNQVSPHFHSEAAESAMAG
jgi:hypothetical protein